MATVHTRLPAVNFGASPLLHSQGKTSMMATISPRRPKVAFSRFNDSKIVTRKSVAKESVAIETEVVAVPEVSVSRATDDAEKAEEAGGGSSGEWQTTDSSSGSAYDTDLESDLEDPEKRQKDTNREVGNMTYSYACEDCCTAPQRLIEESLSGSDINLAHRNLGPRGIRALCITLKKNFRVRHIDLSDNGLGSRGAIYVSALLSFSDIITIADLSRNRMRTRGALALGEMLKENKGLYRLNLSHNEFEEDAGYWLGYGIENNDRLIELDLSHNNLSEKGASFIGNALGVNDCLENVNLSWNHIRKIGAVTLCKAVAFNTSLTVLDLSWNGFAYEGALAIGEMLKDNQTLVDLDLRNNRINWQGATLIAQGLKVNQTLDIIKLGGNPLTTTGTMDIIDAVSLKSCGLKTLDITGIPVIAEFEMMGEMIKHTRQFHYIHGGVVGSHDVLGQRLGKRIDPLQRVIDYMREREIRPTELFRSFDKSVNQKITPGEFAKRIQKAGIPIPKHEMMELMEQIERGEMGKKKKGKRKKTDAFNINYKMLITSVNNQLDKERTEKIRDREKEKRKEKYHRRILNQKLPANPGDNAASIIIEEIYQDSQSGTPRHLSRQESMMALQQNPGLSRHGSMRSNASENIKAINKAMTQLDLAATSSTLPNMPFPGAVPRGLQPQPRPRAKMVSMSSQLGSSKSFGAADVKKKKKKKRKTKSKRK